MAEPAGYEVASAYVSVGPDATDFPDMLAEQLGGLQVSVAVVPADLDAFTSSVEDSLDGLTVTVTVRADTDGAESQIEDLTSGVGTATLGIDADTGDALAQAEQLAGDVSGMSGTLDIGADTGSGSAAVEELTGQFDAIDSAAGTARSAIDAFDAELTGLEAKADQLSGSLGHVVTEMGEIAAAGTSAHNMAQTSAGGIVPITVVPDVADFQDRLADETGGMVVSVTTSPDVSDFQGKLDSQLGNPVVTVPIELDTSDAQTELDAFTAQAQQAFASVDAGGLVTVLGEAAGAEEQAGQAAVEVSGELSGLNEQLTALNEHLVAADQRFLSFANTGRGSDEMLLELQERLEGLYMQAGAVGAELTSAAGDIGAAGTAAGDAQQQVSLLAGMLGELEDSIAGAEGAIEAAGADFFNMQDAAARLGVSIGELPDALAQMDAVLSTSAAQGEASIAALNASMTGTVAEAGVAEDAVSGFSGILGTLGERMSYMAIDPFLWMMALPAIVEPVVTWLSRLEEGSNELIASMAKQDQATGYNISGYENLSNQLAAAAASQDKMASSLEQTSGASGKAAAIVNEYRDSADQMTQAQQQAASQADNLSGHLGTLEDAYGLSQQQAEALATAAGATATQLAGSGAAADAAMTKIETYANANQDAQGAVSQMSNDMLTFGNDALTASTRVNALDNAYNLLVGNFVSSQTDMLTVAQDFLGLESMATVAGASMKGTDAESISLQQTFYTLIPAIEQTAEAMTKQGDSVQQVSSYLSTQVGKLSEFTGGNKNAETAVQGLKTWEDNLRDSTSYLGQAAATAANQLESTFTKQVENAGVQSATAKTDVSDLSTAILNNGANSDSAKSARAALITDLEQSGVNAQTATKMVNAYTKAIQGIPAEKALKLTETASGTWSISQAAAAVEAANPTNQSLPGGYPGGVGAAEGGLITSGSRISRADDVNARLSHGEYVVQAPAVSKYGVPFLESVNGMHYGEGGPVGYAGGGAVGASYEGSLQGMGGFISQQYQSTQTMLEHALMAVVTAAIAAARSHQGGSGAAGNTQIVNYIGTQHPTPEQQNAMLSQLGLMAGSM